MMADTQRNELSSYMYNCSSILCVVLAMLRSAYTTHLNCAEARHCDGWFIIPIARTVYLHYHDIYQFARSKVSEEYAWSEYKVCNSLTLSATAHTRETSIVAR